MTVLMKYSIDKQQVAVGMILLVSVCAFAAGYVQSILINQMNGKQEELHEFENQASHIEFTVDNFINHDFSLTRLSHDLVWNKILDIAIILDIQNDTLTIEEKTTYIQQIDGSLDSLLYYTYISWSYDIYYWFDIEEEEDDYVITSEDDWGYDFTISKEEYTQAVTDLGPIINTTSISELLPFLEQNVITNLSHTEVETINFDTFEYIMYEQVWGINYQVLEDKQEIHRLGHLVDAIDMAVTITTIAVILSSAMSAKLDSRDTEERFRRLRADITNEDHHLHMGRDKIVMPTLVLATILAVLGMFLPLIL